jgi:hypothetical protein
MTTASSNGAPRVVVTGPPGWDGARGGIVMEMGFGGLRLVVWVLVWWGQCLTIGEDFIFFYGVPHRPTSRPTATAAAALATNGRPPLQPTQAAE